jgi:hypothetical protein
MAFGVKRLEGPIRGALGSACAAMRSTPRRSAGLVGYWITLAGSDLIRGRSRAGLDAMGP